MPAADRTRNILYYCSGFHWIGGVETFEYDVITSLPASLGRRWVAAWSSPLKKVPLLAAIRDVAERFVRCPLHYGARWDLPDRLLWLMSRRMVGEADLIVFAKLIPLRVHRKIRRLRAKDGRPIPSVLVIPYRPSELWPNGAQPGLLECFDVIVATSPSFAGELKSLGYRGTVEVISLIPPPPPTAPPPPRGEGNIRLGFLGRLEPPKNLTYMLEIMRQLAQTGPLKYELHMYGDGSLRAELQGMVSSDPLLSNVTLHGLVGGSDKIAAIDSCDLFLNSSFTEGQPVAVLEILSRGRPMMATPVGALPDILTGSVMGRLIPLGDAGGAARVIAQAAEDWRRGKPTSADVRSEFERRYGRQTTLNTYARLFEKMLTQP